METPNPIHEMVHMLRDHIRELHQQEREEMSAVCEQISARYQRRIRSAEIFMNRLIELQVRAQGIPTTLVMPIAELSPELLANLLREDEKKIS